MFQHKQQQTNKYLHPHHNTPYTTKSPNKSPKHHPPPKSNPKSQNPHNPKPQQPPPTNFSINFNKIKQMQFLQNITNDFPETPLPSTTPQFSETNQNVGIIFWYSPPTETPAEPRIQILAGVETCYLTDKLVPEVKSIIEKYQIYTYSPYDPKQNQNPHEVFSKRAKLLSKELKMPIYFDKPIQIQTHIPHNHTHTNTNTNTNTHTQWQVQYRVINEIPKLGILKGSMEEAETKEEAIQREIQEELFPFNTQIPLNQQKITELPHTIYLNKDSLYTFHYQLNETEKAAIEKNIQLLQNQNYGELVHYQFRPLNEFFPTTNQPNFFAKPTKPAKDIIKQTFNGKSRLYLQEFHEYIVSQQSPPIHPRF
jgi:hypothetical protein